MKILVCAAVLGMILPSMSSAGEGYDAGYRWAERNGIDDPSYCYSRSGGYVNNSASFTEGCLAYLQDEGITNEDDEPIDEDEGEGYAN